jgi:hypothetical protein
MFRALVVTGLAALTLTGAAAALLAPGRTVVEPTAVTSLGVTGRSVVYAIDENAARTRCAAVKLWDTGTRGLWTFGESTTRICREGLSTGSGVSAVATSGRRVYWVTYGGGNIREYTLWTATPARKDPRRLADASIDVDSSERPLVLGVGSREGVPYALEDTITYVADDGRRLFRVSVGSPVVLLAAGAGPGAQRVVAALADGRVVVLSSTGATLRTLAYDPGEVKAVALALPGAVVQAGTEVRVGAQTVTLPPGALLLDFRQGRLVYAQGLQVRSRRVADATDTLLQTFPSGSRRPPLFATDAYGAAWAKATSVSWRGGPLP